MSMAATEEHNSIQKLLSVPILLSDQVIKLAQESESFKLETAELSCQVTHLSQLLRSAARLITAAAAVYDRPLRRVSVDVTKTLDRALTLVRKCRYKKTHVLHHVLSITTTADFKKVSTLIDSSVADMKWVLSILSPDNDSGSSINLSLPPIATTDPILAWVWPYIAAVHMGRAEGANGLANLARDNDRNKKIIVEENGIPPLLKLLKESSNLDAQDSAANALYNLADDQGRVRMIVNALGVQIVVKTLSEAPMMVQVTVANLISRMLDMDVDLQEDFWRENITRPLVTILGMDVDLGEFKEMNTLKSVNSLHSLVRIKDELTKKDITGFGSSSSKSNSNRKEKERLPESPMVKSSLKVSCAMVLWKLARGSLLNSKKITETKALLVLAKMIENETGDLQINCLKVVMELTEVAESNADLKRTAFRPNSPAAKAVLDQLLRVINDETNAPLVIPAVKAIGCLATMFSAKEKTIVARLVAQLSNSNLDVAYESANALGKFVCKENYNRVEHSKAIVEFKGVQKVMSLIRRDNRVKSRLDEVVLLCNLAVNVGNRKEFEEARVLNVVGSAARHAVAQNPELREVFAKAIHQLTIYQAHVQV